MACDNRQYKWGCLSWSSPRRKMLCSLDDRKCYKRNQTNSTGLYLGLVPFYITIVHLFLFVNGDVLLSEPKETHGQGQFIFSPAGDTPTGTGTGRPAGAGILESDGRRRLPVPVVVGLFDGVNPHKFQQRQVKRDAPAQAMETLSRNLTSDSESLPSTLTNPGDKANAQPVLPSSIANENQNLAVQAENGATRLKTKASSESNDTSAEDESLGHGPSLGLNPDAMLRLFYVLVSIGVIVLIYILIKFLRFRRKRATKKYRVLSHTDDQEMFPLAADDGDDEEIFNAADHQSIK